MRTPIRTVAGLALLAGLGAMHAQTESSQTAGAQRTHRWWTDRPAGARAYTTNAKTMPLISVKGNKFIDPQGRTILFRGLSISDPEWGPTLIGNWEYTLNPSGEFAKQAMHAAVQ